VAAMYISSRLMSIETQLSTGRSEQTPSDGVGMLMSLNSQAK
jgi:hypothetical protein